MNQNNDSDLKPLPEQIRYANMLFIGSWVGILLLFITYTLYLSGIISPHVDISVVPQYWNRGLHEYLEFTDSPVGWNWTKLLYKGDYMNFVGLVLLAVMTIICYIALIPAYIREKNWLYAGICILEVVILGIAASGILGSGGH
jgi:hypothetical protein